jgi:hypothetical protein
VRVSTFLERLLALIAVATAAVICTSAVATAAPAPPAARTYRLLHMNLCLSGIADCFQPLP